MTNAEKARMSEPTVAIQPTWTALMPAMLRGLIEGSDAEAEAISYTLNRLAIEADKRGIKL